MMKNKTFIYGAIIALVLVIFAIFIWNNYQIQVQERSSKPIKSPLQISEKCGLENCHGLDITCGPNVPEACDMMYMAGDNCRQFVNCQTIEGQCKLGKSPRFDSCKACVEKCERDYSDDQIKFSTCESNCTE